jgi:hypothetical protein
VFGAIVMPSRIPARAGNFGERKMKTLLIATMLALLTVPALAGQVRYYDSRGKSIGTSSTTSTGATTYYNSRGSVVGRSYRR